MYNGQELQNGEVLHYIHDLSFSALAFLYYFDDLAQVLNRKTGAVDGIAAANADSNIRIFDSDEIVRTIPDHPHITATLTYDLLPATLSLILSIYDLLVPADYKGLVLGTDSCKHFHLPMQKIHIFFYNKIIVDRVKLPILILELEIGYIIPSLLELIIDILQLDHFTGVGRIFIIPPFDNNDLISRLNHSSKDGSLNTKKYIVTCNDFGINFCLCECSNRALGIVFEQINKSHHPQNGDTLKIFGPVLLQHFLDFSLLNFSKPEPNTPVFLQRQSFNKAIVVVDLHLRVLMDHFRAALAEDKESVGLHLLHQYRHRLESRFILVYLQYLQSSTLHHNFPEYLHRVAGLNAGLRM
jgi:hypothetical protein